MLPTTAVSPGITSSATSFYYVLKRVRSPLTLRSHLPHLPSLTAHPQTAQVSSGLRLDWQTTIFAPLLASEPNHQVLNFAAECIEVRAGGVKVRKDHAYWFSRRA